MKVWPALLLGLSISSHAAENSAPPEPHEESIVGHEVVETEPSREIVYVEDDRGTYRSTRGDEHCYYHEEHDHIHCSEQAPLTKTVIIEDNTVYRSTRSHRRYHQGYHQGYHREYHREYDPLITGLSVGLAIGLPILAYDNIHHRHYRRDYRIDHRKDHRWDRHSRYRSHRHDRGDRHNHHRGYRH